MQQVFLDKLTAPNMVKKMPAFYETRNVITVTTNPVACPYSEPD